MLKAKAIVSGRPTFIIGLSWTNSDHFRAAPGDSFISIKAEDHGVPFDILIFSDRTEADPTRLVDEPRHNNHRVVLNGRHAGTEKGESPLIVTNPD